MCYCAPKVKTPFCSSYECQEELKKHIKPEDEITHFLAKRKKLEADVRVAVQELEAFKESCSHPEMHLSKEYGSNTGNYDPTSDSYWINYSCECCGKRWTEYDEE